jgi:hypothetical protein
MLLELLQHRECFFGNVAKPTGIGTGGSEVAIPFPPSLESVHQTVPFPTPSMSR